MTLGVIAHLFWDEEILLVLRDKIGLKGEAIADPECWDSITETMEVEDGGDFEKAMRRGLVEEIGIVPARLYFLGLTRQKGHGFFCGFLTKEEVAAIKFGEEGQDFRFYRLEQTSALPLGAAFREYYKAYPEAFRQMSRGVVPEADDLKLRSKTVLAG